MSDDSKKVLLLCHPELIPPIDNLDPVDVFSDYATEHDVYRTLVHLGHQVEIHGLSETSLLRRHIESFSPDICFNLMEEFDGNALMDAHVVSFLELLKVSYTGSNPKGLLLARDKSLSKKILEYHNIPTPKHFVVPSGKKPPKNTSLRYPLFVKSLNEEASLGISQASFVTNYEKLCDRVSFIHESIQTDAIVDEFIEGREFYLAIMGNDKPVDFPLWELDFGELKKSHQKIATRNTKWNESYRNKHKIDVLPAKDVDPEIYKQIVKSCKEAYNALEISGYARFDIRLKENGEAFIIEANPNPNIGEADEFALAAATAETSYPELINQLIDLGLQYAKNNYLY